MARMTIEELVLADELAEIFGLDPAAAASEAHQRVARRSTLLADEQYRMIRRMDENERPAGDRAPQLSASTARTGRPGALNTNEGGMTCRY